MQYKLGKRPAQPGAVSFRFRDYLIQPQLPPLPQGDFGHDTLIESTNWLMLGNDEVGDCAVAGPAHETMMWNREAGRNVTFTTQSVISDYSAITGYDPRDPSTDQGSNVADVLDYRRKTGIIDASGQRHKIAAYLAIDAKSVEQHKMALYLFGAVGIGFQFPSSAMEQFNAGKPWDVVSGSYVEGGHYVPLVAWRGGAFVCVSWARTQAMTPIFLSTYNDESYAIVSEERLNDAGLSAEGFNREQLLADLQALGG